MSSSGWVWVWLLTIWSEHCNYVGCLSPLLNANLLLHSRDNTLIPDTISLSAFWHFNCLWQLPRFSKKSHYEFSNPTSMLNMNPESISVQKVMKHSVKVKASDVICKRVRNLEVVIYIIYPQCILLNSAKYNLCLGLYYPVDWCKLIPKTLISLSLWLAALHFVSRMLLLWINCVWIFTNRRQNSHGIRVTHVWGVGSGWERRDWEDLDIFRDLTQTG